MVWYVASPPNGSMLATLARGLRLPSAERAGFLRAYAALAQTDLALRVRGFQGVVTSVAPLTPSASAMTLNDVDISRVNGYVRWIKSAARLHLAPARCLHESLTLHRWLRADGLPSEIRIGVRKEDGALQAHAWVELCGQIVNDAPAVVAQFQPLEGVAGQAVSWSRISPNVRTLNWSRA